MTDLRTLLLNQDTQAGEVFDSPKERLTFYRSEIHFESTLLASRTSGYLSSQSFLIIAFASSIDSLAASSSDISVKRHAKPR